MVHTLDVRFRFRAALDPSPAPQPGPGDRLAAVLAPLIESPVPSLLFTLRAAALSRHAGEVSFPGGLQDPGETLVRTALREAHEELGLDPAVPDVVGALPAIHTFVSAILVVPFVGMLETAPPLRVSDREIEEVLTFPVTRLAEAEQRVEYPRPEGRVWRGWAYALDGWTIWGATGRMLHTLLDVIRTETPWLRP
jgi:8-oxo-dGTP pyrophosphatase MutT (NUDIX family)